MNLPYRFQEEPGEEAVISVDGTFGAPGLNLSHWPGNTTPKDLRHDLSTGSALLFARLEPADRERRAAGCVAVAVGNSSHAGVLGHHVEGLADLGLTSLAFVNTPAAISPWGGNRALYGTNPIAFACPRADAPPLVIDLSLTKVARGKIKLAADRDEPLADGLATDATGKPTTDAQASMDGGGLLPIGDAKGAALALMVEVMSAAMTGSRFGYEASSFFDSEGGPSRTGQFFFVFRPESLGGEGVLARIEELMMAITDQSGARLPGSRRYESREKAEQDGVDIPDKLLADLTELAGGSAPTNNRAQP